MRKTICVVVMGAAIGLLTVSPAKAEGCGSGGGSLLGTLLGAGGGAFAGHQFGKGTGKLAATGGGALLGGLAGDCVGGYLNSPSTPAQNPQTVYIIAPPQQQPQPIYYAPQQPVQYAPPPVYYAPPQYVQAPPVQYAPPQAAPYAPVQYAPQPQQDAQQSNNCRPYESSVTIGGQTVNSQGLACQQPDGTWKLN